MKLYRFELLFFDGIVLTGYILLCGAVKQVEFKTTNHLPAILHGYEVTEDRQSL